MSFNVSDKVVCIATFNGRQTGTNLRGIYPNGLPIKGSIYVVSGLHTDDNGILGLILVGLPGLNAIGKEVGWVAAKFRKLSEIREENRLKQSQPEPAHV